MKRFLIAVLSTLLLSLAACHKDELPQDCPPGLPCATQTGENTFGCYINGKPWMAGIASYIWDPTLHKIEAEYDETGYGNDYQNHLRITASKWDSTSSGFMSIYIWPIIKAKKLNEIIFSSSANIDDQSVSGQLIAFDFDTIISYKCEITHLDFDKNIVSGIFSFNGISTSDTVRITDGRFDVKYSPY